MRARLRLVQGLLLHYGSTLKHKGWVALYIARFLWRGWTNWDERRDLARRAIVHDLSKFRMDEARGFAGIVKRLNGSTYGSDDYKRALLQDCIRVHYSRNCHHPEFYDAERGFHMMNRADRIEMVADWSAAVRRHADGDLDASITKNKARFGFGDAQEREIRHYAKIMGSLHA